MFMRLLMTLPVHHKTPTNIALPVVLGFFFVPFSADYAPAVWGRANKSVQVKRVAVALWTSFLVR